MEHNSVPIISFVSSCQANHEMISFPRHHARKKGYALRHIQRFQAALRGRLSSPDLASLLSLTRELACLLVAVQPRPEFRAALRRSLLASARQQYVQHLLLAQEPASGNRPVWFLDWLRSGDRITGRHLALGAVAVGSAVSLLSVLAWMVRHYRRQVASSSDTAARML